MYTWHDVIKECEKVIGCEYSAKSPLMCNLPNLIRDLKFKLQASEKEQIPGQLDICKTCAAKKLFDESLK